MPFNLHAIDWLPLTVVAIVVSLPLPVGAILSLDAMPLIYKVSIEMFSSGQTSLCLRFRDPHDAYSHELMRSGFRSKQELESILDVKISRHGKIFDLVPNNFDFLVVPTSIKRQIDGRGLKGFDWLPLGIGGVDEDLSMMNISSCMSGMDTSASELRMMENDLGEPFILTIYRVEYVNPKGVSMGDFSRSVFRLHEYPNMICCGEHFGAVLESLGLATVEQIGLVVEG